MKTRFSKHPQFFLILCWAILSEGPRALAETPQTIEFAAPTFNVRENGRQAVVTVVRKAPRDGLVTVNYAATAGSNIWNSATPGADFIPTSGTLAFASGETNKTFRVQILDDGWVESAETVLLTLSNVSDDAVLGTHSNAVLKIEDNELPTWLDPTFHPAFPPAGIDVATVLVQSDGKILLSGQLSNPGPEPVFIDVVARLNGDGTRDSTFRPVRSPWPWSVSTTFVIPMALQADGKVMIGGVFSKINGISRDNLARLNSDGSVDTNFTASVQSADPTSAVKAILIEPDGRILIGGSFNSVNGAARAGLARLNADGSLDPNSDVTDVVRQAMETYGVLLQPDGKLLVGGSCMTRLNADGSNDPSFLRCDGNAAGLDQISPLAVRSDGRILARISQAPPQSGDSIPGLIWLNPDGSVDRQLFYHGTIFGDNSYLASAAFAGDGSVVVAGQFSTLNNTPRSGLVRFFSDGSPPAIQFSSSAIEVAEDGATATLIVQRTGDSSAAGSVDFATVNASAKDGRDFLAQTGTLLFAPLETVKTFTIPILDDALLRSNTAFGIRLSNASAGTLLGAGPSSTTVTIYDAERLGSVDWSFNPNLNFQTNRQGGTVYDPVVLLQADGKVIVGGFLTATNPVTGLPMSMVRLNPDASLDATFKLNVPYWLPPGSSGGWYPDYLEHVVYALASQPDGKILIGGSDLLTVNGQVRPNLARFHSDGTLDTGFNADIGASNGIVRIIAVQADGEILLGEQFSDSNVNIRPVITRLYPNGELDRGFDMGAGVTKSILPAAVNSIVPLPNGKILIAGDFWMVAGTARNSIARLNPDGSLDGSFVPGAGATPSITSMDSMRGISTTGSFERACSVLDESRRYQTSQP